jgi:preprotein translocase subunit SecG
VETLIWFLHVVVGIVIIVLVLLQQGKGADMGAAFGAGSSGSLFGASGSANFLSRSTAVITTIFFITSLTLTYYSGVPKDDGSVMQNLEVQADKATAEDNKSADIENKDTSTSRAGEIPQ